MLIISLTHTAFHCSSVYQDITFCLPKSSAYCGNSETDEYYTEVDEDDLEDSDSDTTELYEILANMNDTEIEEVEMNMEPEMELPI